MCSHWHLNCIISCERHNVEIKYYKNYIFNRLCISIRVSVALKPEIVFIGKVGWRETAMWLPHKAQLPSSVRKSNPVCCIKDPLSLIVLFLILFSKSQMKTANQITALIQIIFSSISKVNHMVVRPKVGI